MYIWRFGQTSVHRWVWLKTKSCCDFLYNNWYDDGDIEEDDGWNDDDNIVIFSD